MFRSLLSAQYRPGLYLCSLAFFIYAAVLVYKYMHFGYCDWDLASFNQAMWSMRHGSIYMSLPGINFMGDHSHLISFLFLPLYFLAPHPLTLLISKVLFFVLSALMLYVMAHNRINARAAGVLTFLYIIFPANIFGMLYQYNVENYAPVFLLAMWHYYEKGSRAGFLWSALLACLIKENMPLVVFMFGIHALFFKKEDKGFWTLVPMVLGAGTFLFLTGALIPYFRGSHQHTFWVRYHQLGNTPGEVMAALVNPAVWWKQLVTPLNARYVLDLFGPLLPLALLSADALLMILPIVLYHLLSLHGPEHTIFYHYGWTLTPFIFIAVVNSLVKIRDRITPVRFQWFLSAILVLGIIHTAAFYRHIYSRIDYHHDGKMAKRWEMVRLIPPQAGVVASFDFLAELSSRPSLYAFYKVYSPLYQDPRQLHLSEISSGKPFTAGKDVTYVLIDFKDPWLIQAMEEDPQATAQRVKKFLGDFTPVKQEGSIILYRRR